MFAGIRTIRNLKSFGYECRGVSWLATNDVAAWNIVDRRTNRSVGEVYVFELFGAPSYKGKPLPEVVELAIKDHCSLSYSEDGR